MIESLGKQKYKALIFMPLALGVLSLVCLSLVMIPACVRLSGIGPDVDGLAGVSLRVGLLPFLAPQH